MALAKQLPAERKHTLAEAMVEYQRLIAFYPNQGYQVLEVPGAKIMSLIEDVAKNKGLAKLFVDTYAFQAQDF